MKIATAQYLILRKKVSQDRQNVGVGNKPERPDERGPWGATPTPTPLSPPYYDVDETDGIAIRRPTK